MTEDSSQSEVAAFLASPAAFDGESPVRRIDTHFSIVTLAGDRALKLKRAVANDLLDFGTIEKRRDACRAEVAINRRTAPDLYLDAKPVTRGPDGALRLGGTGEALDWVVVMRRFENGDLFLELARNGRLSIGLIDGAADAVARLHAVAEPTPERGGFDDMTWIVEGNLAAFDEARGAPFDGARVDRIARASRTALDAAADLLERRRREGATRRCHGDLHLGNICLVDGAPTLFDAIEFNDRIACCDPLYDLAFLVMDLWQRGHRGHANRVLNRWLWRTGAWQALPLLPLYLSCRAAVRAKTSVWASALQSDAQDGEALRREACAYLELALACLERPAPDLLALGGLSGTGKTTLALALAPDRPGIPGAVVLRSDVQRKQRAGVAFEQRLGVGDYDAAVTAEVYGSVAILARGTLAAGISAIADAVFLREEERDAMEAVARDARCKFAGLWLEAPRQELAARVDARRGDASDADASVVALQARHEPGDMRWRRIDASGELAAVLDRALGALATPE